MDLSLEKQCLENGSLTVEEVAILVEIAMEYHEMTPIRFTTEEELLEFIAGAETAG